MLRTRARALLLALTALVARAGAAEAHQFEHPKVLRLGVKADRLLLEVSYDLNPGPDSQRVRAMFDRDADGALDAEEQDKLARFLEETALLFTRLEVNGQPAKLEVVERVPNHLDRPRESSETVGIAAVYQVALPATAAGAELRLVLRDRDKDRARHVPLVIDLAPGWEVALASQGELHPKSRRLERILLAEGAPLELRLRRRP